MRNLIPATVTRTVSRGMLKAGHHSPTILFVAGVAGMVTTAVLASRATLKVEDKIDAAAKDLQHIDEIATLSQEEKDSMRRQVNLKFAGELVKLYGPSVLTGVASVACLTKSHTILVKRNAALTAAYVVLEKAFNEYRGRVKDELGTDADQHFLFGTNEISVVETDEKGDKVVTIKGAAKASGYSQWFDAENINFQHINQYNLNFLMGHQRALNDRLKTRGFVFLNEAYEALGFPATQEGQIVGWWWGGEGDNVIDFGIFDNPNSLNVIDRRRGGNGALLLDFNVDGPITKHLSTRFVNQ